MLYQSSALTQQSSCNHRVIGHGAACCWVQPHQYFIFLSTACSNMWQSQRHLFVAFDNGLHLGSVSCSRYTVLFIRWRDCFLTVEAEVLFTALPRCLNVFKYDWSACMLLSRTCYTVSSVGVLFVKWDELVKLALVKLLQKSALLIATVQNSNVFFCQLAKFKKKKSIFIDL